MDLAQLFFLCLCPLAADLLSGLVDSSSDGTGVGLILWDSNRWLFAQRPVEKRRLRTLAYSRPDRCYSLPLALFIGLPGAIRRSVHRRSCVEAIELRVYHGRPFREHAFDLQT